MRKQKKKNISSDAWFSKKIKFTIVGFVFTIPFITVTFKEINFSINVTINGSINTPSSSH
ncbi:hypothetical protein [Francisella tularensis]|uniref:hypothetical protein n=1 Tax=Francisella tularensis TaxID=263 RepID=UPI0008F55491|nr:hypothetical protein [Francisella tularensis]APA82881.1 hypothetical protein N894_0897 [Francisella tularensis subsp. novicida PA10-7858]